LGTRADLVRGTIAVLLALGAAMFSGVMGDASTDLAGSFRAEWETSEVSLLTLNDLTAVVSFSGETWRTSGRLSLTDGAFASFDVTDERTFGPLWLRTSCVFDPDLGFSYLGSTARFALLDLQVGNYVFLSRDPALSYDQLTTKWTTGGVALTGVWRIGLCPLDFRSAQASGQWYVPRCDLFMDVRSVFTCAEGFEYLRVTGRFPRVSFFSNDVIQTELRLTVQFEVDRKELSSSLRMRAGSLNACITPFVRAVGDSSLFSLDGVELYGWLVECAVDNVFEMQLATSLDPTRNRELTGEADYWEAWKLSGAVRSCCGRDLQWELSTYFEDSGASLFDWGLTAVSAEIPLAERLTARIASEFRSASPLWTVFAGFEIRF